MLPETGKQFPVSSSVVPMMLPMTSLEAEPEQVSGGVLIDVPVDQVFVGRRMRTTNALKVSELAQSFLDISIINPISIDENYKLIAGNHRLAAGVR